MYSSKKWYYDIFDYIFFLLLSLSMYLQVGSRIIDTSKYVCISIVYIPQVYIIMQVQFYSCMLSVTSSKT
jgi:hypothetical protein